MIRRPLQRLLRLLRFRRRRPVRVSREAFEFWQPLLRPVELPALHVVVELEHAPTMRFEHADRHEDAERLLLFLDSQPALANLLLAAAAAVAPQLFLDDDDE